jgi:hypothetical protein
VQERFNDLVVGTYGRGFWILDDITPLQQLTADVAESDVHLFAPRDAYRFQSITSAMSMSNDPSDGNNPPYGASINYWLSSATEDDVTIRIEDSSGETVRTLGGTTLAGINRVWWDLRGEPSTQIRLRTKPLYADWVALNDERWRPAGGRISMLQPPGEYTVILDLGGRTFSQRLTVLKDPNSEGSEADIGTQLALVAAVRDDLNDAAEMVNRIEWVRRQLYDLQAVLEAQGNADELVAAAGDLDEKAVAVEESLIQLRTTGTGQDGVRWPSKLVGRLGYLAGAIATADFPPTDQQREVHEVLRERLRRVREALDALLTTDLPAFNRLLQQRNLAPVITDLP